MLLRSSSTPILNSSWIHYHSKDSSPEPDFQVLQRTKSISLLSSSCSQFPIDDHTKKVTTQALQESCLQKPNKSIPKIPIAQSIKQQSKLENEGQEEQEEAKPISGIQRLFSSSGLGERVGDEVSGRGGDGGNGGGRGSSDGGSEFYGSSDSIDAYYQEMIKANPGDALLLGNYAKFLKEVRRDLVKAEEFCGRAILANPNDGYVLSMYGDIVWQTHKNAQKAESYFDRAVKAAPDDCFVLASYARFLWDAEEEENEDDEHETDCTNKTRPSFFHGPPPHHPSLAAAS